MENAPEQTLNCSRRPIFSMDEVRQEKIKPESELQVVERGHQYTLRVQDKSGGGSTEEGHISSTQKG